MSYSAERIETMLLDEIAACCPGLSPEELQPSASLTADLGLDSLCLTSLFSMVKAEIGPVELSGWFIRASNQGTDTVASLAGYLAHADAARRAA